MSLLVKSKQNFEIAELAEAKCYYDVAISRLYYSNIQRLIHFINRKSNRKKTFNSRIIIKPDKPSKGSHEKIFEKFGKHLNKFNDDDIFVFTALYDVKESRRISDYEKKTSCSSVKDYNEIKDKAIFINNYIDEKR